MQTDESKAQKTSSTSIIQFPELAELREEVARLHTEISMLILERDELLLQLCPNIEANYMLKIGGLEYQLFAAECKYLRQKRRFELITAKRNRGERVNLPELEQVLELEFREYKEKLNLQLQQMNEAIKRFNEGRVLTEAETLEIKTLYRKIVKKMHPDLHPDLNPEEIALFNSAVEACEQGNLPIMRAIAEAAEGIKEFVLDEDSMLQLHERKNRMLEIVETVRATIAKIKASYPYSMKSLLEDEEKLEARRHELQQQLQAFKEATARYVDKEKGMLKC